MSSKPILCSSYNESVQKYTEYIKNHVNLVKLSGLRFFKEIVDKVIIPRRYGIVFKSDFSDEIIHNLPQHDKSKFDIIEFDPYRIRFYPCPTDNTRNKEDVEYNFQKAFKRHYTCNPHHPEFWVSEPDKILSTGHGSIIRMSNAAMLEMLADWIAMSIAQGSSILNWWLDSNGGIKEKSKLILKPDVELISEFIESFDDEVSRIAADSANGALLHVNELTRSDDIKRIYEILDGGDDIIPYDRIMP